MELKKGDRTWTDLDTSLRASINEELLYVNDI